MPYVASNCGLLTAYNSAVTFGKSLRRLRGAREGPELALIALGKESGRKARRDFANYLSRIERDRVPNVGLSKLRLVSTSLGFEKLSDFFADLERQEAHKDGNGNDEGTVTPTAGYGARAHESGSIPSPDAVALAEANAALADLRSFIGSLSNALAAAASGEVQLRQAAGARAGKAASGDLSG